MRNTVQLLVHNFFTAMFILLTLQSGSRPMSVAESVRATAEAAMKDAERKSLEAAGMAYDNNSGMYYDYNSGYYYDAVSS